MPQKSIKQNDTLIIIKPHTTQESEPIPLPRRFQKHEKNKEKPKPKLMKRTGKILEGFAKSYKISNIDDI